MGPRVDVLTRRGMHQAGLEGHRVTVPVTGFGQYLDLRGLNLAPNREINDARMANIMRVVRGLTFIAPEANRSGHPGGSSSKAEATMAALLGGVLAYSLMDPKAPGRDRIVDASGHTTPNLYARQGVLYYALRRAGWEFDSQALRAVMPKDLPKFRSAEGPQGHVEPYHPTTDAATGSSGHGPSTGGGMGVVFKGSGLPNKALIFAGDAEMEEGMTYEFRNIMATNNVDNTVVYVDYNGYGITGPISDVIGTPFINHWLALGWNVVVADGHNVQELTTAFKKAYQGFDNGKPTMVLGCTVKGKDYMREDSPAHHGSPTKNREEYLEVMRDKLGFKEVNGDLAHDIEVVTSALTDEDVQYIVERVQAAAKAVPSEEALWQVMEHTLPGRPLVDARTLEMPVELPPELVFSPAKNVATRFAAQNFMAWLQRNSAFVWSGVGDLEGSILTLEAEKVWGVLSPGNPTGRAVRWGIAEQNMAMMSVGMALTDLPHGIQPVSFFGSYGTFAGTMISNAVRMGLIANHVLEKNPLGAGLHQLRPGFWCVLCAHDGPETGEDGPTHHGLFWPALYGALPGMDVYRPFDANETIAMLFHALKVGRPIALSLSRPDVPVFARGEGGLPPASEATNGAYVIKPFDDPTHKDNRAVIVVAGGQTLANTLPIVPDLTRDQGLDVKVIGVTSPTLFRRLRTADPAKAASVLSDEERNGARIFSVNNGWRYFNVPVILTDLQDEAMIGVDTYLPSGKPSDLYRIAGLDPDGIKRTIVQQLEKGAGK